MNLNHSHFLRLNGARNIGIRTSFGVPVVSRWGVTFVIVFYSRAAVQVRSACTRKVSFTRVCVCVCACVFQGPVICYLDRAARRFDSAAAAAAAAPACKNARAHGHKSLHLPRLCSLKLRMYVVV